MSKYKLTYYNHRGTVEHIRYMFALADQPYEDVRIKMEDWPKMKNDTPFGVLPLFEVDGLQVCQAPAITRFLAKRFGLAGKTELNQLRTDMVAGCIQDAIDRILGWIRERDTARKAELKVTVESEIPGDLEKLQKLLMQNNGGNGYFVGDSITNADLVLATYLDRVRDVIAPKLDEAKFEKLFALRKRVESNPKIAAWIAKRPVTQF